MKRLTELQIDKKYISILCSGFSTDALMDEDFDRIKKNSFTIAINEALIDRVVPDARFWYDYTYTAENDKMRKNCLYITNLRALRYESFDLVDYVYPHEGNVYEGNYSVYVLLQLLKWCGFKQDVLIFGMDCTGNSARKCLCNGELVIKHRERYDSKLHEMRDLISNWYEREKVTNVWNCSDISTVKIPKIDYKEILNG